MEENSSKNVLITGGAGYVGQVLLGEIPEKWKVTVIDNVYVGNENFTPNKNIEFVKGDIRDKSLMKDLIEKTDVVIHLAGIVGDSCPINPKSAQEVNVEATENIAKLCDNSKKRLIFMSTCSVYGFNESICNEKTEPNPLNPYSHHKVLGEKVIEENSDDWLIFRMGTVYGWSPRMRFDLGINLFIEKSLWNEQIQVFGGNQWRPLTHVKDASRALIMGAEKADMNTTLNLVGENHLILDIAKDISDNVEIVDYKDDNRSYKVDNSRILNELKWSPKMDVLSAKDEFEKVEYQKDQYYNKRWNYN
tara:strand:+ start:5161 stop:6075 length:915 start_codon:yes stop_codon:yes gene_type:complete